MKRLKIVLFLIAATAALTTTAQAEVVLGERHIVIIRPGVNSVWGNYLFGVRNLGATPEAFEARVMLPEEMVDFQPQEGVKPNEIKLDDDGKLLVSKTFPPGLTLISIAFKVDGSFGKATMTFKPAKELSEFTLMTKDPEIGIESAFLSQGQSPMTQAHSSAYRAFTNDNPIKAGQAVVVTIDQLARGRSSLWLAGSAFAAVLAVLAAFLAIRTKPSQESIAKTEDL